VAFEFRHVSWFEDETFAILKRFKCALCVAESSELATPRISTAGFGYLRLRREDYTDRELAKWAEWIRSQPWKETFVYFKHEEKAVGPAFATKFQDCAVVKPGRGVGTGNLQSVPWDCSSQTVVA